MDANATKRRPSKGARIYHGIVRIAGGCMLGYLALFFLPAGPWTNLYCPVSAKARYWGNVPNNQYARLGRSPGSASTTITLSKKADCSYVSNPHARRR